MSFGWYYEGGNVQEEWDNVWQTIEEAAPLAAEDDRLHALLVGEMRQVDVSEYLTLDDLEDMQDNNHLTIDHVVRLVSERHYEQVWDGCATLCPNYTPFPSTLQDILQWATDNIWLDPSTICEGRHPLPIELYQNTELNYKDPHHSDILTERTTYKWIWGDERPEPPEPFATIVYTHTWSSHEGAEGPWLWWVNGELGNSKTLTEAMKMCESLLFARGAK